MHTFFNQKRAKNEKKLKFLVQKLLFYGVTNSAKWQLKKIWLKNGYLLREKRLEQAV